MTDLRNTLEVLERGRANIAVREQWTQGTWIRGAVPGGFRTVGHPFTKVKAIPESACAFGAIIQQVGMPVVGNTAHPAFDVLRQTSEFYFGAHLVFVNDNEIPSDAVEFNQVCFLGDAHENVLFVYDKAIATVRELIADVEAQVPVLEADLLTV